MRAVLFAAAASLALTGPAWAQSAAEKFHNLLDAHWAHVMEQNPTFATTMGVRQYDDHLGRLSLESMDADVKKLKALQDQLREIDAAQLPEKDQLNYTLFAQELASGIKAESFGERSMLFTTYSAWHSNFANLPDSLPFFTKADYESYVARLNDYPRYNKEGIETTRYALKHGYIQPCAVLGLFDKTIAAHIVDDVSDSVFMKPFARQPGTISDADWRMLKTAAETAIRTKVVPAYQIQLKFFQDEYIPKCRHSIGASELPDGKAYYAFRVKLETTTDLSPDQIHEIGLSEVKRIRGEMDAIIKKLDFKGDFKAFQNFLRTDPRFYAKTPEALLEKASRIAKRMDGNMPKLFGHLPRMPYGVQPVPDDIAEQTATAYYDGPSGDGTRAGTYYVNTSKLDTRPLFELEALTLHESVPGHHHQIARQQELDLPNFRRFGGVTAFTEGWALYAERLGLEVGFYQDPYADFGRLSYEMWRACRLVVDTGMHAKGWSKQQAVDFMAANTALSLHNIEAEVNRYISWPGQALAYKMGQLKISDIRARAEKALGRKFDIRAFHDKVLENGAIPLNILDAIMTKWIAEQQAR